MRFDDFDSGCDDNYPAWYVPILILAPHTLTVLEDLSTLKHLIVLPDLLASLYFELNILPKTNLRGVNFAKPVYKVKRKAWLQQRHTPGINTPRIPADLDRVWMIWDIIQHGRGITQFFLPFPHSHLQALSDYDHDDLYGGHLLTVALRSPTARCVRHGLFVRVMLNFSLTNH